MKNRVNGNENVLWELQVGEAGRKDRLAEQQPRPGLFEAGLWEQRWAFGFLIQHSPLN